jgi:predicted ester cyclase
MGIGVTNRSVRVPGINIFRLRDGMITERWGLLDMASLVAQLGAAPSHPGT